MKRAVVFGSLVGAMMMASVTVNAVNTPYVENVSSQEDIESAYQFELDGVTYALPLQLSDFQENGWDFSSDYYADYKVPGMTSVDMSLVNEKDPNSPVGVIILNPSGNAQLARECRITGVIVNSSTPGIGFKTVDGISLDSTRSDVEAVYGQIDGGADYMNYKLYKSLPDYTDAISFSFMTNDANSDTSYFQFKDDKTYRIELAYYKIYDDETTEVSQERPAYLEEKYHVSSGIDENAPTITYELDGISYSLPTPIYVLEADGWVSEDKEIPALQSKYTQELTKGDEIIKVDIQNDSDYLQDLSDCYAYCITVSAYDNTAALKTVMGIETGMTEDTLLATVPQFDEIELDGESGSVTIDDTYYNKYISDGFHSYTIGSTPGIIVTFGSSGMTVTLQENKWKDD